MPLRKKCTMNVEIIRCCSSRYYKIIIKVFSTSVDEQASNSVKSFAAAPVQHQKLIKTHSCVGRSINLWHDQNLGVLVLLRQTVRCRQNRTWKWRRRRGEEERRKKTVGCISKFSNNSRN
jgi:hypothetical protein